MLIAYDNPRFIFIHIYKAAGKSVAAAMEPSAQRAPNECIFDRNYVQHLSARHLQVGLPREVWSGSFKFSFVRNPWDRWVSLYEFIVAKPKNHDYERVAALGSFDAFIRWVVSGDDPEVLITRTQEDFLCDDNGNLLVDRVGRFESLAADFEAICAHLGLSYELPHHNANTRTTRPTTTTRPASSWRRTRGS